MIALAVPSAIAFTLVAIWATHGFSSALFTFSAVSFTYGMVCVGKYYNTFLDSHSDAAEREFHDRDVK